MPTNRKGPIALITGIAVFAIVAVAMFGIYQIKARGAASAAAVATSLTLNPDLFTGETQEAYKVAEEHPDLLAQLHCYCGCEQHEGMKNLLDCFRTNHGAGCAVCVGEAVTAGQLYDRGTPVDQILNVLRDRYGHEG